MATDPPVENLLRFLPQAQRSIAMRYAISTLFVAVFFLIRLGLPLQGVPYLLFIPPVFLSAVVFDRGSGFFAAIVSTFLALYAFVEPRFSFAVPVVQIPSAVIFLTVCFGIAAISEALRQALERALLAEQTKDLLLRELSHRTRNSLATIATLLRLEGARVPLGDPKDVLRSALGRIEVIAAAHDQLDFKEGGTKVEMQAYLQRLGRSLGDALRGLRPITVRVEADSIEVAPETAAALGLVTNELVTNALKYGFPDGSGGAIDIKLRRDKDAGQLVLSVADEGHGLPDDATEGLGTTIVKLLVQQLNGRIERDSRETGLVVRVTVPLEAENRS